MILYYFPKKSECSKNAHIPNLQTPYKRCSNGNTTAFKSCSDSFIVFRLFLIKHNVCVFGRVIHVCVELHFSQFLKGCPSVLFSPSHSQSSIIDDLLDVKWTKGLFLSTFNTSK